METSLEFRRFDKLSKESLYDNGYETMLSNQCEKGGGVSVVVVSVTVSSISPSSFGVCHLTALDVIISIRFGYAQRDSVRSSNKVIEMEWCTVSFCVEATHIHTGHGNMEWKMNECIDFWLERKPHTNNGNYSLTSESFSLALAHSSPSIGNFILLVCHIHREISIDLN